MSSRLKLWHAVVLALCLSAPLAWGANKMWSAFSTLDNTTLATGDRLPLLDISDTTDGAGGTAKTITADEYRKYLTTQVVGGTQTKFLTAQHAISSTTATEMTDLKFASLATGTYVVKYWLIVRSATATVGLSFGVNYTGTLTKMTCHLTWSDTGTTATNGVADDSSPQTTGQIAGSSATKTASTTAPNMGYTGGVATTASDTFDTVECIVVTGGTGDLAIWHASETATATSVEVGSSAVLTRTN